MIRSLYIIILLSILFLLSACGSKDSITLINRETGAKQKIDILEQDIYDLSSLPQTLDGYYIKYSTSKSGSYINSDELFRLIDNTLYYSYGIKEDFFDIENVGKVDIVCSNDPKTDKEYVPSYITISGQGEKTAASAQIKLRGNTTLWTPKKSFKIKFNEKQNVLGMGSDKEWALLANYFDPTYLRNYYAYKLAMALGLEYSCEARFVEVYFNHQYIGLYLLTETIKTSKERVDIEKTTTSNEVPFLLELDMKIVQDNPNYILTLDDEMFLLDNTYYNGKTYPFGTKYPKSFKDINENQYAYIKNYISNTFESVRVGNYEEYIDIDSVINYFLIQELFMNVDLDYSSVYMYKALGEKLKFGPIWDFDLSSGNVGYVNGYSYDKMMKDVNGGSYLFNELYKYEDFKNILSTRFAEINLDIIPSLLNSIYKNREVLSNYAKKDNLKWDVLNDNNWARPENLVGLSYNNQVRYFKDFLSNHNEWLKDNM